MNLLSRLQIKRLPVKSLLGLGCCAAVTALLLGRAAADTPVDQCAQSGKGCTFAISNNSIQKVPMLFKLQAQISQAKVPLEEAVFSLVTVKLKSGNTELCKEDFPKVRVRSGVLNLEIGRDIRGCQMDDVVAKYNDLAFQICIGDGGAEAGNCLKPIQISSVPYAMKASFASQAQEAYRAELASRAHYAQRVTADGTMLEQQQLGAGYYDFQTPSAAKVEDLKSVYSTGAGDVKGGFLQWSAVEAGNRTLNVSAKDTTTNALVPLSKLLLHATDTGIWGRLNVTNTSNFIGRSTFVDGLQATGTTSKFSGGLTVDGGLTSVQVPSTFSELATMTKGWTINGGLAKVDVASTFSVLATMTAGLNVSGGGATVTGGATVNGMATMNNGATVTGGATVNGMATMNGGATVHGLATMTDGATIAGGITATSGVVDVQTSANFGAVSGSSQVSFRPGTIVDMSAATVVLPNTVSVTPNITVTEIVSNSATGCLDAQAPINAKFCGISSSAQVSTVSGSCKLLVINGRNTLRACSAFCSARCF